MFIFIFKFLYFLYFLKFFLIIIIIIKIKTFHRDIKPSNIVLDFNFKYFFEHFQIKVFYIIVDYSIV